MKKRFDNSERVTWRSRVERATEPVRREKAARLLARGRELAARERRSHVAELVKAKGAVAKGIPIRRGDRVLDAMPRVTPWHASRALGLEEHFQRVDECGDGFVAVGRCTSPECVRQRATKDAESGVMRVPLGCSSRLFCDDCKLRIAQRFRREFNASRMGVMWAAKLQGRDSRWRPKYGPEAKFGERLITLTVPHVGTTRERVRWAFAAWRGFLRELNAYQTKMLRGAECTKGKPRGDGNLTSIPVDRDGCPVEDVRRLCHTARVFEWTPGADGQGHPHFHVWHFGPYIPHDMIEAWWSAAWAEASGHAEWMVRRTLDALSGFLYSVSTGSLTVANLFHRQATRGLLVDVRKVTADQVDDGDGGKAHVANELIKYMTKDWGADAEVMGELYAEIVDRRARQTSRGFANFAVQQIRVCEACGCVHESEEGFHWQIESLHGESVIERSYGRDRTPPDYGSPEEPTEHEIVQALFEEAYARRTLKEREAIIEKLGLRQ